MTKEELYAKVVEPISKDLGVDRISTLHKAMIEECCETALASNKKVDIRDLVLSTQVAFLTANNTLKSLVNGILDNTKEDRCAINYRSQSFVLDRNLKQYN